MATHAALPGRKFLPARMERQVARCKVQVNDGRGDAETDHDATLHDVSSFGCRVSGRLDVDVGKRVSLRMDDNLPVEAVVVWSDGGVIACRFDKRLDRKLARSLTLNCH